MNSTIYSKKAIIITPYINRKVLITRPYYQVLNLLYNREFLFKLEKLNKLLAYIYIVDYNISYIIIYNNFKE